MILDRYTTIYKYSDVAIRGKWGDRQGPYVCKGFFFVNILILLFNVLFHIIILQLHEYAKTTKIPLLVSFLELINYFVDGMWDIEFV
jgi:hypothetical protein